MEQLFQCSQWAWGKVATLTTVNVGCTGGSTGSTGSTDAGALAGGTFTSGIRPSTDLEGILFAMCGGGSLNGLGGFFTGTLLSALPALALPTTPVPVSTSCNACNAMNGNQTSLNISKNLGITRHHNIESTLTLTQRKTMHNVGSLRKSAIEFGRQHCVDVIKSAKGQ